MVLTQLSLFCCCCCFSAHFSLFGLLSFTVTPKNNRALRYFRVDHKDYTYFNRTLLFFDANGSGEFTFSQFIVVMWNFLSLDAGALAEWSFRIFFGGEKYEDGASASQDQVFHMLDVMYGISKEFDYHPNMNFNENSSDRDVQQMRMLVKKVAGRDGTVEKRDFVALVKKTPMLLMRIISAHTDMRKDCVGTAFWNAMAKQRKSGTTIEILAKKIEQSAPKLLWKNSGGGEKSSKSSSKYVVEQSSPSRKKTKLDHEEDRAALQLQNAMRSKVARKKVRKARAVKNVVNTSTVWSEVWDPHYQANYYYNSETGETAWEKPPGFVSPSGN